MGSVAKKGLQKYLLQLQHHPLRTKGLVTLFLEAFWNTQTSAETYSSQNGRPWMHVKTRIKEYPKVQLTAWTFWPVVGWVNHQYVPLQFRVIFSSLIAFCWGIFLNLRARSMALPKSK